MNKYEVLSEKFKKQEKIVGTSMAFFNNTIIFGINYGISRKNIDVYILLNCCSTCSIVTTPINIRLNCTIIDYEG